MSVFRDEVSRLVDKRISEKIQTVQGVIPTNTIDIQNWTATVRIPNPHSGIHPAGGKEPPYIELQHVPLPFDGWNIFTGISSSVEDKVGLTPKDGSRPCQVSFRGGSIHFPYIVSMSSHIERNKESPGTPNRGSVVASKVSATASKPVLSAPKGLASAPATAAQKNSTLPSLPNQLVPTNPTLPKPTSTLQDGVAEAMSNTYIARVKQ